jgi:hypothetical protein
MDYRGWMEYEPQISRIYLLQQTSSARTVKTTKTIVSELEKNVICILHAFPEPSLLILMRRSPSARRASISPEVLILARKVSVSPVFGFVTV